MGSFGSALFHQMHLATWQPQLVLILPLLKGSKQLVMDCPATISCGSKGFRNGTLPPSFATVAHPLLPLCHLYWRFSPSVSSKKNDSSLETSLELQEGDNILAQILASKPPLFQKSESLGFMAQRQHRISLSHLSKKNHGRFSFLGVVLPASLSEEAAFSQREGLT